MYGTDEYSALELNGFKNLIVKILSYEDLAIMKLFSTRTKDLEDLIQYIFSKISSYSELKQKIETYKEYYVFNSELPELNLNQLDFIKDRLRKEQKVILVEDSSIRLVDFLKSLRLLTYTQKTYGKDSVSHWLDKPLIEVATQTSLLGVSLCSQRFKNSYIGVIYDTKSITKARQRPYLFDERSYARRGSNFPRYPIFRQ